MSKQFAAGWGSHACRRAVLGGTEGQTITRAVRVQQLRCAAGAGRGARAVCTCAAVASAVSSCRMAACVSLTLWPRNMQNMTSLRRDARCRTGCGTACIRVPARPLSPAKCTRNHAHETGLHEKDRSCGTGDLSDPFGILAPYH